MTDHQDYIEAVASVEEGLTAALSLVDPTETRMVAALKRAAEGAEWLRTEATTTDGIPQQLTPATSREAH